MVLCNEYITLNFIKRRFLCNIFGYSKCINLENDSAALCHDNVNEKWIQAKLYETNYVRGCKNEHPFWTFVVNS